MHYKYLLPPLPYSYDALEPYIDAKTMEIHYTKHHQGYIDNLNGALINYPDLQTLDLIQILGDLTLIPEVIRNTVRNNGGGHYNHSMFWVLMKKNGGGYPKGKIGAEIVKQFQSFDHFKQLLNTGAKSVFGSGWCWLVVNKAGNLEILATPNQDSPISNGLIPIFGIDVWEHAYYLKYQNRRPEYIEAWWNTVNWDQVEENYKNL